MRVRLAHWFTAILMLWFVSSPPGSAQAQSVCDWTGTWNTDYGEMILTQIGNDVSGTYLSQGISQISGTVSGNDWNGNWVQSNGSGGFAFSSAPDCNSFTGTWGYDPSSTAGGGWNGSRVSASGPVATSTPVDPEVTLSWVGYGEDLVGTWSDPNPNGTPDGHFQVDLDLSGANTVTGMTLVTSDYAGNPAFSQTWDTISASYWILGVLRDGSRLNPTDRMVSDPVNGGASYQLYGNDSGYFIEGQYFQVTLRFSDGSAASATTAIGFNSGAISDPAMSVEVNECSSWGGQGQMAGCVVLHGGFTGTHSDYVIDLFEIACDTSYTLHAPTAQEALLAQLRTGRLDFMQQDDSVVVSAQLTLNGGTFTGPCGPSTGATSPAGGIKFSPVDNDPANRLWNCDTNRVPFGDEQFDKSRCFTFTYPVPPEGISGATLHLGFKPNSPGGQDTDALVVSVGRLPIPTPAAPATPTVALQPTSSAPAAGMATPNPTGVPGSAALPLPAFGSPQPDTSVSGMAIQAAQRRVFADDLTMVPVWLIQANGVANLNVEVSYNGAVAIVDGPVVKGNLLENALFTPNSKDVGILRAGFAQTSGLSGTGTVMNIPFLATGKPGDRTGLEITVTSINDPGGNTLAIQRIPGEILIVDADGSLPGGGPGSTGGPASGSGATPGLAQGDCDGDGQVTESDALCALEMSVKLRPERPLLDVDRIDGVTSRDAVIILMQAVGKPLGGTN